MSLTVSTISRQILPNFTVSQCDSLFDRDCVSPIQTKLSDANGVIVFDVPEGFRGHYFSPQQENFAPNILHSFPPPDTELPSTLTSPFLVANLSEVTAAAAVVGVEILPDTGAFLFGVQDCSGNQLAGVTLTATPSQETTETIYLAASGLPDPNLQRTGSAGSGAIANLPPGNVTIKAEHEEFGVLFEQTILAVPGTITGGTILPAQ